MGVQPAIAGMRRSRWFLKTTAVVVAISFLGLTLQPLAIAAQLPPAKKSSAPTPRPASDEERLSANLEKIEARLSKMEEKLSKREDASRDVSELKTLHKELEALDKAALDNFDKIKKHLEDKKLPKIILDRQEEAVRTYRREMETLKANLEDLDKARDDDEREVKARKVKEHLKAKQKKKPHTPLDPNNLPFRVPDAKKTRKPAEKKDDFQRLGLLQEERIQLASTALLPGMLTTSTLAAAPSAADLAQTEDVQITPEIQALATSLGNNPVKIYNWVRNNINFTPTYGSIQGSQACYLSRECNAIDTASLLIALLRASGVHARYVIGTIDVPIENFKSYVGNFTDSEAALNFVASAGTPITGIIFGGGFVTARMEHVWVEAWVDYYPSFGAVHKQGDTWIPLEASLKPMQFQAPLDVRAVLGVDPNTFFQPVLANAVQGPNGESITGLSQTAFQTQISGLVGQLKTHISTNMPNATVGEVLGGLSIKQQTVSILPGSLPANIVVIGSRSAALPAPLRASVGLQIKDQLGIFEDISINWSTVSIARKRISLGYVPATAADAATVASYGGFYRTPAYLLNVRPVVYLDGVPAGSGAAVPMGSTQRLNVVFQEPDGRTETVEHRIIAGGFYALGLDLQRISKEAADQRTTRLRATLDQLGKQDVPWDEIMGEILNLHAAGYFLHTETAAKLAAHQLNVVYAKRPAEVLVTYTPNFAYVFGLPKQVVSTGMQMDARRYLLSPFSRSGEAGKDVQFMQIAGTNASAAEHGVFELLQNTQAVSAVKLLAEANNRGMPIFRVDANNLNQLLPQLTVAQEVIADITNAVRTGKTVFVHKDNITLSQWTGAGYVVFDPQTGAGAYLIKGGLAGGGTAGPSNLLNALSDFVNALNVASDFLSLLAKGGVALTQALKVLEAVGIALGVLSAIVTAVDIATKTNSLWAGIFAGLIDASLTYVAGASLALLAPLLFPGGLAVGTVLFALAVAIGAAIVLHLIKTIIFEFLFGVAQIRRRISVAKSTNVFWPPNNSFTELPPTKLALA